MTAFPAGFTPLADGLRGRINQRRRRVQFGEGYVQSSPDGVNPVMAEFTLDFHIWGDDKLNEMLGFLESVGAGTITYTLPNETTPHEYEVMDTSVRYLDAYQRLFSIDLKRVY